MQQNYSKIFSKQTFNLRQNRYIIKLMQETSIIKRRINAINLIT